MSALGYVLENLNILIELSTDVLMNMFKNHSQIVCRSFNVMKGSL